MNSVNKAILTDWKERLSKITEMMREMSQQTDPEEMVRSYGKRARELFPMDRRISLSRRGLRFPEYRITRSSTWKTEINPWKEKDRLPLFKGGLLADLIYGNETVLIDDLNLDPEEPAIEYLFGFRSMLAIPMYDQGEGLNMVLLLLEQPNAFSQDYVPDIVWQANLFGRATGTLVIKEELRQAYLDLDQEMKSVGEIQRSLLPSELPKIPTLDLAAHYQPARRAGGDYYDFFPLPDGKWGIFIADVSGHGTPAAVLMAVTHCIAHTNPGPALPPSNVLKYLNYHLASRYTGLSSSFVTAFYGIYDPALRTITYSSAGHNPPRLKRCSDGSIFSLDQTRGFPLGITDDGNYQDAELQLYTGDQIIFYTDGITEAMSVDGEQFGMERLDLELENCSLQAQALMNSVLEAVDRFSEGRMPDDDRTIIVGRVV
jgi:phosphoserine phosphatase RsbU/P